MGGKRTTSNEEASTTATEYADLSTAQKGIPIPVVAGEQLVGGIAMSRSAREYVEVAPDDPKKK